MRLHPAEINIVPSPDEVAVFKGMQEIRTRKDASLVVRQLLRPGKAGEPASLVIAVSPPDGKPHTFDVSADVANSAFESPYSHAPKAGQLVLESLLTSTETEATQ